MKGNDIPTTADRSAHISDMEDEKSSKSPEESETNVNRTTEGLNTSPSLDGNMNQEKDEDKKEKDVSVGEEDDIKTVITNKYATFRRRRITEKLIFVLSTSTLVILALSLMNIHWFLPYYYAIATPILLLLRIIMYSKNKWQYFLIDFCYFANVFCYIYIWAAPDHPEISVILFAISNGPLAWATVMFRNALVFHDMDRMISCYIHILPMAFSFGLRWYPVEMSLHWFTGFNDVFPTDVPYIFIWVFAVPLACFIFHNCLYLLIVYGICKPDDTYLNSLRYLSSKRTSWQGKCLHTCGQKYILLTFTIFNFFYSTISLMLTIIFYKYFVAHVVYMTLIILIVTWNGASFYIEVFAVKGFKS